MDVEYLIYDGQTSTVLPRLLLLNFNFCDHNSLKQQLQSVCELKGDTI